MGEALEDAIRRWKAGPGAAMASEWPDRPGVCPACGSHAGFHRHPDNPHRWVCFSNTHNSAPVGRLKDGKGAAGSYYTGDALDLACHAAGMPLDGFLRDVGYLTDRQLTDEERAAYARRRAEQEAAVQRRRMQAKADTRTVMRRIRALRWGSVRFDLDHELMATFFRPDGMPTAKNPNGLERVTSWRKLAGWLEAAPEPPPRPDGAGETWKAKDWLPGWTATRFEGARRSGETVLDSGALLVDIDSDPEATGEKRGEPDLPPDRLHELMAATLPGVAYLAHTSPSSRVGAWRWRVVVPFDRRVNADEYGRIATAVRMSAIVSGWRCLEADPGWTTPARFFYGPATFPDYHHHIEHGAVLNVARVLGVFHA